MPRKARIVVANTPHHIIQRGHDKKAVFVSDEDYTYYLDNLREWKQALGCKVYAYCLMSNHVHLIVDPGSDPGALGLLMKRVAGRQTRHVNTLEGRSGTLWEGRYKSSPIQIETYLLACSRYIELNPVRAKMVKKPEEYRWSSYRVKVGLADQGWIDIDPGYRALGRTQDERAKRYLAWVRDAIPEGEWNQIRAAVQRGQLTGTNRFINEVARRVGQRVECRPQGRPRHARK